MANLWRTQRPRIPQYASDGSGRDYYIKYNNGGLWEEDHFKIIKKPEYEYPRYNNYHTLFHLAAPVKFIPTGAGRETYIINSMGFCHDQRPLASYQLGEFLRNSRSIEAQSKVLNKRPYKSKAEKRYNIKLQTLEKQLIHRLYNLPMNIKKKMKLAENEEENALPSLENNKDNDYINTQGSIDNNNTINGNEIRVKYIESMPNINNSKLRKKLFNIRNNMYDRLSLNNNLYKIMSQTEQIENYEMKNNSRRSNNESDYNVYKDGKVGCRMKNLSHSKEIWNNLTYNRLNTDGNENRNRDIILSMEKQNKNKKLRTNKLVNSFSQKPNEIKYKTLEY
jgi:hypothetical protein